MTIDTLQSLETEKFQNMLKDHFSVSAGFVLADFQGRILEVVGSLPADIGSSISNVIKRCDVSDQNKKTRITPDDKYLLLLRSVEAGNSYAFLAMFCEFAEGARSTDCSVINHVMELVFESIFDSLSLNCELNDMADDLSARYEELNLFYALDDIVEGQDPKNGKTALKKLADNCAQYLNTDMVSIIVKAVDINIEAHALCSRDFLLCWRGSVAHLTETFTQRLNNHSRTIIMNDSEEVAKVTDSKLSAKLAVTPIHSTNGSTLGYLLLARLNSGRDFTNSDRRLLRVVAEQASTIVSTGFDVITGLLNRDGLHSSISSAISGAAYTSATKSLLILDLDQFKVINDSCGRSAGDELLKQVANQLKTLYQGCSMAARIEADKFAVLVTECGDVNGETIASEVIRKLSETGFRWDGRFFDISAGIGIVNLTDEIIDADEAFALGAISCDVAKQKGPGGIFAYDSSSASIESARIAIDWIPHVRTALENDSFELYAQQIVPLQNTNPDSVHYEILLRLRGEDGSVGSPFQMIKAAEVYNMVTHIDEWVIKNTLLLLKECLTRYPDITVRCSINMSGQSVTDEFFAWLKAALLASPALIPRVNIEITETHVVSNLTSAIGLIESLRSIGVTFSLDDFGTGMSSFGYLRDIPVDYLKIDGSFVKHIVEDPISHAMVESIHRIGHLMGLKTVAEFVENDLITEKLKRIGIDYGQGYGLNKPAPFFQQVDEFYSQRRGVDIPESNVRLSSKAINWSV